MDSKTNDFNDVGGLQNYYDEYWAKIDADSNAVLDLLTVLQIIPRSLGDCGRWKTILIIKVN